MNQTKLSTSVFAYAYNEFTTTVDGWARAAIERPVDSRRRGNDLEVLFLG